MHGNRRLLVALMVGAAFWVAALAVLLKPEPNGLIDLQVYRTGGNAWLHGMALYDRAFPGPLPGPHLPFTYPPLAAVLFATLTVLPWWVAVTLVSGVGLAGLALACWLAAARLRYEPAGSDEPAGSRAGVMLLAAAAAGIAPLMEPVNQTVSFGQINLLLAGAVTADCLLRRTPWPRGALIGVAAAVKLTPAAFVLFFLARRQWRPALVAIASFAAAGLLGLLLAPRDTRDYWLGVLLDPSRIGGLAYTSNQSLRGLLHRLDLAAGVETAAWLALSAAVAVLAVFGIAAVRRRGDDTAALLVTAAAALLVSPVSWSHHWVWVVPGVVWLAAYARRRRTRASVALLLGTLAVFMAAPFWWLPHRDDSELDWTVGQHVLGNAYVWVALAVVAAGAVTAARARRTPRNVRSSRAQSSGSQPSEARSPGAQADRDGLCDDTSGYSVDTISTRA